LRVAGPPKMVVGVNARLIDHMLLTRIR